MTTQPTDEMRAQVLGQALITITRQKYECMKLATTRYQDALREAREAMLVAQKALKADSMGIGALDSGIDSINKLLGDTE